MLKKEKLSPRFCFLYNCKSVQVGSAVMWIMAWALRLALAVSSGEELRAAAREWGVERATDTLDNLVRAPFTDWEW